MSEVPLFSVRRRSWLPPAAPRGVPWSGAEIVASLILVMICLPQLVAWLLNVSGFYSSLYGPDLLALAHQTTTTDAVKLARARLNLWVPLFALPIQVIFLPLLLFGLSQTRPKQLGLTGEDGWRNLGRGVVGAFVLIPVVLSLNALLVLAFQRWAGVEVELHPLFRLGKELQSVEWVALFFAVLVSAPVMEELTLRGLLQPWLARYSWGGLLVVGVALFIALDARLPGLREAVENRNLNKFVLELQPALFILVMSPGLLLVQRWSPNPVGQAASLSGTGEPPVLREAPFNPGSSGGQTGNQSCPPLPGSPAPLSPEAGQPSRGRNPTPPNHVGPAIYGTALLFASLHSFAWPSPIALFVLGLGLGCLAWRTQSLVGPIVLHMLFNAVGCLQFLSP